MTVGARLKLLRKEIGLSQEAIGAQGFVSTMAWIKIENGQRSPGDDLVMRFIGWLIKEKYINHSGGGTLMDELLTLKYLGHRSAFVRKLAYNFAKGLFADSEIRVSEDSKVYRLKPRARRQRSNGGNRPEIEG